LAERASNPPSGYRRVIRNLPVRLAKSLKKNGKKSAEIRDRPDQPAAEYRPDL